MGTAALVGGTVAAGALSAGGSALAGHEQAGAAESAAQLQYQESQNALNFQQNEFNTQQANEAPWLAAGKQGLGQLSSLLSTPGQGLLTPFSQQFNAPTAAEAAATPGFNFEEQQGQQAIQRSAAAQGGLLSGGTAKALDQYSQGLASSNYQQTYNNAMQQYLNSYNIFQGNQSNQFNKLASLSGLGQTAAGQLGQEGQAAAQNVGNIDLTSGAQQGQDLQNAAAANASGYVGAANSIGGTVGNLGQLQLLSQLLGNNNFSGYNLGGNGAAIAGTPGYGSDFPGVSS